MFTLIQEQYLSDAQAPPATNIPHLLKDQFIIYSQWRNSKIQATCQSIWLPRVCKSLLPCKQRSTCFLLPYIRVYRYCRYGTAPWVLKFLDVNPSPGTCTLRFYSDEHGTCMCKPASYQTWTRDLCLRWFLFTIINLLKPIIFHLSVYGWQWILFSININNKTSNKSIFSKTTVALVIMRSK